MVTSLKKLFILILLPLVFSSCEFSVKSSTKEVRTPQSDESFSDLETAQVTSSADLMTNKLADINKHTMTESERNVKIPQQMSAADIIQSSRENSPERQSLIDKLCSLPREFANPVLYDRYCHFTCLNVGNHCEEHNDCCSHNCSGGLCQAGNNQFVPIGEKCFEPSQCETGLCAAHPTRPYKICYGSLSRGICSFSEESCFQDDNCCSGRCYKNKCVGSPKYPNGAGQACYTDNNECASNQCVFISHKCR